MIDWVKDLIWKLKIVVLCFAFVLLYIYWSTEAAWYKAPLTTAIKILIVIGIIYGTKYSTSAT